MKDRRHAVTIQSRLIGVLHHRGDAVRFSFAPGYWEDPDRQLLGLWFEDNPGVSPSASLRLPAWFSNLLPEGRLRDWIARDRGVSSAREIELLLRVGADLPGAVQVIEDGATDIAVNFGDVIDDVANHSSHEGFKFSLAGVGLKFSMIQSGERLTLPGYDQLGDWIVKLPDAVYPSVPENEFNMMTLARAVGIDVPEVRLVPREELPDLPSVAWPKGEGFAYAVRRFDRSETGRIHIEDFAQARGFYPDQKYDGSFETVAAYAYRRSDLSSLTEFVRRLVYNLLIGNGDAHLKNWSLIYPDGRRPKLSPAYDLVSTAAYFPEKEPETLGLKLGGNREFGRVSRHDVVRLEKKLRLDEGVLTHVVDETLASFWSAWNPQSIPTVLAGTASWISRNASEMTQQLQKYAGQ